jgi:O-antigen ligase
VTAIATRALTNDIPAPDHDPVRSWPQRADAAGRWCTVGLVFAVPVSTALANIMLVTVLACWLAGGRYRAKLHMFVASPVPMLAAALFGWLLLSLAWAGGVHADQGLFLRKYADLPMMALFAWFMTDARWRAHALSAFAAAMLLTLVLSYAAAGGLLPQYDWLKAVPGNAVVFKLHITHGLLMALAALLFGLNAFSARQLSLRIGWGFACLAAVVNVLLMVQGRTGYVVLAAFVLLAFATRLRWRGVAIAAVLVAVGAVSVYQSVPSLRQRVDLAVTEFSQWERRTPAADDNSIGRRLEFFSGSIALVTARPLAGYGLGNFPSAYRNLVEGTGRAPTVNPHNEYLLLAVQAGLPALLLFCALLCAMSFGAARLTTLREQVLARALALWMTIGCVFNALLIDHTESLLFALLAGVLFAGAATVRPPARGAA